MKPPSGTEATWLWDRLMRLQTDLSQPIELPFFFNCRAWLESSCVLDVGCGNAYYLRHLARYFPGKSYLGIDMDLAHIETARRERADGGITEATPMEFLAEDAHHVRGNHDAALVRLLVQHLRSLDDFLGSMRQAVRPGGVVIVIESSDEVRKFVPPIRSMARFFEMLRANRLADGCDRDAGQVLADKAQTFSFEPESNAIFIVPSTIPGHKDLFLQTYLTVFDLTRTAFGVGVDYDELAADLRAWWADPASYTQLGVHIASYRRS